MLIIIFKKYAIKKIKAREVLDSRGNPTVEVDVVTKATNKAVVTISKTKQTTPLLILRFDAI